MEDTADSGDRRELRRVEPAGDHFVLITLPSGDERLEPLLNLSAQGVAVLLRSQRYSLQPGAFVPRVRFFTEGECTLQCQARIRDVTQVSLENGAVGVKLGLSLELPDSGERQVPQTDTYDEPQIIADTLHNVVKARAALRIVPDSDSQSVGVGISRFLKLERDADQVRVKLADTLRTKDHEYTLRGGERCELRGELYGTRIAFQVEVARQEGPEVTLRWPQRLVVWRHRSGGRLRRLPRRIEAAFEAPFSRDRRTREVIDLSARGLALLAEPQDGLMVGMLLPELTIKLPGGTVRSRGVVRNVRYDQDDRLLVGVEIVGANRASTRVLEKFVDQHLHPSVRVAELRDLKKLWPVYEKLSLFEREHAAVSPLMGQVETTRQTLLTRAHDLSVHLVGGHDDEIFGNAELLQSYRSTWSLQHLGVLPGWQLTADQLVVPLVEMGLRRDDFDQLHAMLNPSASRLGLSRLRAAQPDPEHLDWRELVLFTDRSPETRRFDLREVQDAGPGDRQWLLDQMDQRFSALHRATLDLVPNELQLESTWRRYHQLGLERKRRIRMAFSITGPLGFSMLESTSPGTNFQDYLDLVRIIPTRSDELGRKEAILTLARDAVQQKLREARRRSLLLLRPEDAEALDDTEFTRLGTRIEVFASRAGAAQIVNFVNLLLS